MKIPSRGAGVRMVFLGWVLLGCAPFVSGQVSITEIMYNPGPAGAEGRAQEFVEIFNATPEPIDLSGWYFSSGIDYVFRQGFWLPQNSYVVICADPAWVRSTHSLSSAVAIGPWSAETSLANSGELIALCEPSGAEIIRVDYNDRGKWPGAADGTGHSLEIESPYAEVDDPDSWNHSRNLGGSPGRANPTPLVSPVVINEGHLWTGGERWVEFYNTSESAVSLSDFYVTTDAQNLTMVQLGGAITIPGRGWLAFSDVELGLDFTPVDPLPGGRTFIALVSSSGDRVIDARTFEPSEDGYSEARFPDGDEDWQPAATPTRGAANELDVETDLVISEIMYHPIDDDESKEYVELYNRGPAAVSLDGCEFTQGIDFVFPAGTSIPSGGFLVVAKDPARIRSIYGLPASVVIGPDPADLEALDDFGRLANGGERLTLKDFRDNTMDTVRWYDGGEWPRWADGLGSSLELIDPYADNSRPAAWDASDDSHKAVTQSYSYSDRVRSGGESELHLVLMNRGKALIDDVEIRAGGVSVVEDTIFVPFGDTWRYRKGTQEASTPVTAWRQLSYDDSSWSTGDLPIGYGEPDIVTELSDMGGAGGYLTIFCRKTFDVADRDAFDALFLDVRYDDGFIAYLNGVQIASRQTSGSSYDSPANGAGEPTLETLDITSYKSQLVNGTNVLAIQLHNASTSSSDALLNARIYSGVTVPGGSGPNLVTNGTFDASDSGWVIEGNHIRSGQTTEDPITGAGSLMIVSSGRGDNKVNRIETETSPSMQFGEEYTVSFKARWIVGSRTILTHGYQNLDTNLARSHQLAIPENLGTPGDVNSVTDRQIAWYGDADMGPTISKVDQSPAVPQNNESVTVRAKIEDPDGVAEAKVVYFVNRPGAAVSSDPDPVGIFYDHRDIGAPCGTGSTTSGSSTSYVVTGGGDDIWQGGDQFHFAYTYADGDFDMRARIVSKNWASGSRWGKAGIMARQSLSSTARYSMIQDHGEDLQDECRIAMRPTDGGSDNFEQDDGNIHGHPAWIRLTRVGDVFRGYRSDNGTSWTQVGDPMNWGSSAPDSVLLGLAVTSHAGCGTSTIGYANVTINGDYGDPTDPGGGTGNCTDESCEVAMTDPDGDGTYMAVIPGMALGEKVLFAVEATDANGNWERRPADVTLRSHPLQLDPLDNHPANQHYYMYRHDIRNIDPTSPHHKYRFVMHDLDEQYLDTRRHLSNDYVDGSFVFGTDDLYYNSKMRFSGSPWARSRWGSFRLRLPHDDPLHGQELFQCNLEENQGAGSPGHQRVSYYLFRYLARPHAPVPYEFPAIVRFWVNSRGAFSRYRLQAPNGETLERFWQDDDDGDFFEVDDRFVISDAGTRAGSRDAYLRYPPYNGNGDNQEEYRWYFNLRQDEDGDNYGNLIDLARVMDPGVTGNAQFDQTIESYVNIEQLCRNWAVRLNTDDWDSWGANRGKNCYLFRPELEGLWQMLPWDMELTYGNDGAFPHPTGASGSFNFNFPEVNRLLDRPRFRRMYYGVLKEMVDGPFRSTHLSTYMLKLDSLGAGIGGTDVGKSGGFVDRRRNRILNWISPVVYPQVRFNITSPSDGHTTQDPVVDISGTAPVEVFFVGAANDAMEYQDGDIGPVEFSTSSMTAWTLNDVPLAPGTNNLTLVATDTTGGGLRTDTIQIVRLGSWDPPEITAVEPSAALPGEQVVITGSEIHSGVRVYFGATRATDVVFNESTDPTHVYVTVPIINDGSYALTIRNVDGQDSNPLGFTVIAPPPEFIRGDANMSGIVDLSDAVKTLFHLFSGHSADCRDSMDSNDDGDINVTDALYTLGYLFQQGPPPAAPFPAQGVDPTETDALDCEEGL